MLAPTPLIVYVVFQVGSDASRAGSVIADSGLDAGVGRAPLNHAVGVLLPHGVACELHVVSNGFLKVVG
jgi:hypothetical protein